ncbi:MAG: glycosyltransferase [Anaerolineaceae bacterium]|nr:glycosyltransferase [Anaerolineaceae bacterium]
MHILLIADGRSPITKHWINGLLGMNITVSLISTYPCSSIPGIKEIYILPVAFAGFSGSQVKQKTEEESSNQKTGKSRSLISRFRDTFLSARYTLGPMTLPFYRFQYRLLVQRINPDLVHALRIPYEGMLAAATPEEFPLIVSTWGNDLTFHAYGSAGMRKATKQCLSRANGLTSDTKRDVRLSRQWGFDYEKPSLVIPGAGGIDLMKMNRLRSEGARLMGGLLPENVPLVINPRGFRPGSVHNDVFFKSIPMVLNHKPDVKFLCVAMQGQAEALQWIQSLNIEDSVELLPYYSQQEALWHLFQKAEISVSISSHDGTPNSLLEAMANGCFPIAGDIESLREWITPGVNGLLIEPTKPEALASAILQALDNPELRQSAAVHNQRIITERAEVSLVQAQLQVFYQRFLAR